MKAGRLHHLLPDGTRYYRVAASRFATTRLAASSSAASEAAIWGSGCSDTAFSALPTSSAIRGAIVSRTLPPFVVVRRRYERPSSGFGLRAARPSRRKRATWRETVVGGIPRALASSVGVRSERSAARPGRRTPRRSRHPSKGGLHELSQRHLGAKALEQNVRCTLGWKTRGKRSTGIHAQRYCHMEVTCSPTSSPRRTRSHRRARARGRSRSSPTCSGASSPARSRRSPASCPAYRGKAGSGSGIRPSIHAGRQLAAEPSLTVADLDGAIRRDPGRDGERARPDAGARSSARCSSTPPKRRRASSAGSSQGSCARARWPGSWPTRSRRRRAFPVSLRGGRSCCRATFPVPRSSRSPRAKRACAASASASSSPSFRCWPRRRKASRTRSEGFERGSVKWKLDEITSRSTGAATTCASTHAT